MSTESPYGSWKSPLSSKLACDSSISIREIYVDSATPDKIYWSELRPKEDGRTIIFSKDVNNVKDTPERWTPNDFNVGSRVHEYGGGAFTVHNGSVYFVNFNDQNLYKQIEKELPKTVTNVEEYRYADGDFAENGKFLFCVREDHSANHPEPVNTIVAVNLKTGHEVVVASGTDFYAYPRVSLDGTKLVWMQWKHPNMPWDDSELWLAEISYDNDNVRVENGKKICGEHGVNFMEPRWGSDGKLMFICDKTGWWNLYSISDFSSFEPTNLCHVDKEIGSPAWQFGHMSFCPHPEKHGLIATLYEGKPALLNVTSGSMEEIELGNSRVSHCLFQPGKGKYLYLLASDPAKPQCLLRYDMDSKQLDTLHESMPAILDSSYLSVPKHIKFPVDNGSAYAYGYYYGPKNKDYHAPAGTLPPLLIKIHGGPTSSARMSMDLNKQYFTSRGIAILDVNYRGSTGYGTPFRKALYDKWGIYDIEDACAGALFMATDGVDGERVNKEHLLIDGGSAGGYTTLASLTFRKVFRAGVSYYGVSDLEALAKDTHKFESRYMDLLIAPYPSGKSVYDARSPIKHLDLFKTPCAFFQGGMDKVVPPDQAKLMFDQINDRKIPCAYVLFPDEAHGFKKSGNKQKSLDGEFYFYSKMLHFQAADHGIEIPIENLPN